jgi:hypothetical protein
MGAGDQSGRGRWVLHMDESRSLRILALSLLLFLGIAARVFVAWALMESSSSDHGVPCLMAKHIAEGKGFPVFYYGQPYMGSLEPALGALLTYVFGMNGFAVNLGTALFGIALLPIVYAWGRRAGGAVAGLSALLFCVIGPFGFFQFQSWSYGGYAAIVFFCALLVFGAAWLVVRERDDRLTVPWWYLGFGLTAGAAWWTAPHTLPAILTAAVLLLLGVRWKLMGWRALLGLVGFITGSLPFWIWNARHEWATFAFLSPGSGGNVWEGVRVFFGTNMLRVLGLPRHSLVWMAYAALSLLFLVLFFREIRPRLTERGVFRGALLIYLLVASLLAGGSRFSGPSAPERYLLHMVPFMAVALGCVTQFLARRLPWGLGLIPVAVLFALHLRAVPVFVGWAHSDRVHRQELAELETFLERNQVRDIYAPYPMGRDGYALNFLLEERFTFSDPRSERYPPYRRKLELARSIGVLKNLHEATSFLKGSGGTAQCREADGLTLHYNFTPPADALVDITPSLSSVVDSRGIDVRSALSDAELESVWQNTPGDGKAEWLELRWTSPQSVCGIHLYSEADLYGYTLQLQWLTTNGVWVAARDELPKFSNYFWSGERPYIRGELYRQGFRFGPFETTAVRLHVNRDDVRSCSLSELRVFAGGATPPVARDDAAVLASIAELGLDRVYADRWMANRIHQAFDGAVATSIHPNATNSPAMRLDSQMRWSPTTALVAPRTMISSCEATLAASGFQMARRDIGGSRLYYFGEGDWAPHYAANHSLLWTGLGCLKRCNRTWAAYLDTHAEYLKANGRLVQARETLERAVGISAGLPDGMARLADLSERLGDAAAAARWRREDAAYRRKMTPDCELPAAFGSDIALRGISLSDMPVAPGDGVDVVYFWCCAPTVTPADWAVFVHFVGEDGKVAFQDDHVFLENQFVDDQPFSVVFRELRHVRVPDDVAPGLYEIRLGVCGRAGNTGRLAPESAFPASRRRVELPISIEVRE